MLVRGQGDETLQHLALSLSLCVTRYVATVLKLETMK